MCYFNKSIYLSIYLSKVLDILSSHYKDLFAPTENVKFDNSFQKQVEENLQKYCSETYDHHDDPLEDPIAEIEVCDNCSKLRLLRKWYGKMSGCVSINGRVSNQFPVKQGVRQVYPISPSNKSIN